MTVLCSLIFEDGGREDGRKNEVEINFQDESLCAADGGNALWVVETEPGQNNKRVVVKIVARRTGLNTRWIGREVEPKTQRSKRVRCLARKQSCQPGYPVARFDQSRLNLTPSGYEK